MGLALMSNFDFDAAEGTATPVEPEATAAPAPAQAPAPDQAPALAPAPAQGAFDFNAAEGYTAPETPGVGGVPFEPGKDFMGRPLVAQPPPRQWSVFGTPLPGTAAAEKNLTIHPASRAVLQNFDLTEDISANSAALKKIVKGVYGPTYNLSREVAIPVDDLTDDQLRKIVEQPRVERALQIDSVTRRRMAEDAEEAAILRGELPIMLAAEGAVNTMMRMMAPPETRTPEATVAQQDRGVLTGLSNALERGITTRKYGLLISAAQSLKARAGYARGDAWQTFSDVFYEKAFGAEGKAKRDIKPIPNPVDLFMGAVAGVGAVLDVYGSGGYNEKTAAALNQQAYAQLKDAFDGLKRVRATLPMSRRAGAFMQKFNELPDNFFDASTGLFQLIVENPLSFAAAANEILAEQAPVLAASAVATAVGGPAAGITVSTLGTFFSEKFNVDDQRTKFIKEKTGIDLNTTDGQAAFLNNLDAQRLFNNYGTTRGLVIAGGQLATFGYLRGNTFIKAKSLTGMMAERTLVSGTMDGLFEAAAGIVTTGKADVKESLAETVFGMNPIPVGVDFYVAGAGDIKRARDAKRAIAWLEGATELKGQIAGIPVVKLDTAASVLGEKLADEGIETVYITASELDRFDQDGSVAQTLGLDRADVQRAAAEGDVVEVTASAFVRHILGKDGFDALIEHTAFDLNGMTPAEAAQYEAAGIGDQIQQQIEERARARLAPGLDDTSLSKLDADMGSIQDQVAAQLEATGMYDANKSRLFGLLTAQRYATRAIRRAEETGQPVDARALFDADNLQITGRARVQPTGTLEQEGGFEAYRKLVDPEGRTIPAEDRPNLRMGDMYGMLPKDAEVVGELDDVILHRGPNGDYYATAYNADLGEQDVVGYIQGRENGTELAVVEEMQGKGIGSELQYLFRRENPLAPTGGLTEAGARRLESTYDRLAAESMDPLEQQVSLFQDRVEYGSTLTGFYEPITKAVAELSIPQWKPKFIPQFTPDMQEERDNLHAVIGARLDKIKETGEGDPLAVLDSEEGRRLKALDEKRFQDEQGFTAKAIREKATATGSEIWAKLNKVDIGPGNSRKDALKWSGLEEFLTSDPSQKFSRQTVLDYLARRGVNVDELVADGTSQRGDGEAPNWAERTIESDDYRAREEIDYRAEDLVLEFDIENQDSYPTNELINIIYEEGLADASMNEALLEFVEENGTRPSEETQNLDFFEDADTNLQRLQEEWDTALLAYQKETVFTEDVIRDAAERLATDYYNENPYMEATLLLDNDSIEVWGNDDIGYQFDGRFLEVYSMSEAQIQAADAAREQGRLLGEEDEGATRWEEYTAAGPHRNYRERKLRLPDIEGDFYNDVHFADRNIVAFLRESDRRTGDGRKVFVIEEFQSDWHQQGRQYGYATGEKSITTLIEEKDAALDQANRDFDALPEETYLAVSDVISRHLTLPFAVLTRAADNRQVESLYRASIGELSDTSFNNGKAAFFTDLMNLAKDAVHKPHIRPILQQIEAAAASEKQAVAERQGIPDAPFSGDGWMALGLKRALVEAARNGYETFAWPNANVLSNRWSSRYETLYVTQYDKKMPSIVKKLTGQTARLMDQLKLDVEIDTVMSWTVNENEQGTFDVLTGQGSVVAGPFDTEAEAQREIEQSAPSNEGFWVIDITPELRSEINAQGFSLLQDTGQRAQGGQAAPRGGFTPSDLITDQEGNPVNLLQIFEKADPTTFLHESGHFWLEQLKADALSVGGQFDRDWNVVKNWWASRPLELREEAVRRAKKAKDKDAVAALQKMSEAQVTAYARDGNLRGEGTQRYLSVAMHEQFARGVENYFATGRAPSLSLASLFSAFRVWVSSVYAKLAGAKLDVKFSPEVTAVIDRMLAADEEISLIEGQYNLAAMYTTAEQAGMTPTKFAAYQKQVAEAKDERRARQLSKHIKELKRARTKWWKEAREGFREEASQQVASEPAYRLLYALTNQGLADGSALADAERVDRMDRALLKELLEAEGFSLDDMPKVDGKAVYEDTGVSPAVVAAAFGYEDVDAMILDLVGRQPYKQSVEESIDALMEEEHGSLESAGEAEALASAYSEKTGRVLAAELEAMRTSEPAFKQKFVRAYARDRLLNTPSAEVRPFRFLAAEARHAKLAGEALKRGDKVEAYRHQFQRLVNHYMAAEALKAQSDIEKKTRYMRGFLKQGKKFGGIEADYVDNILRILAAVNFGQGSAGQQSRLAEINALQDFIEERQKADGSILDVPAWLLDTSGNTANSAREMTYLRFLQLHETIKRYEKQGRAAKKIRVGDEEQDRALVKAELLSALAGRDTAAVNRLRGKAASAEGVFYGAASVVAQVDAQLLKVEALLEAIDGKPLGVWHQAIYEPFNQAATQKNDLQAEVSQLIGELIEALPKEVRRSFGKRVDVGTLGRPGMKITRGNLIMLALNVGNESNLDKLIRGMGGDAETNVKGAGWNINEQLIDTALEQLTQEEWNLVKAVWQHAEKLYPAVEAIYRREHGISPDRVAPRTIKTKFGDIKGGYFPMMYDRTIAGVSTDLSQKTAMELMQAEVGRATVNSSMTKARTGYAAPVDLDISRLALGMDNTIHFITHYEAVRNANKILGDKDVRAELEQKIGPAYADQIVKWVAALASNGNDSPPVDIIQKGMQSLYNNTTVAVLGFSYSTLAMQTLGLLNGQDRLLADTNYGPVSIAVVQKDIAAGVAAAARPQHVQFVMEVSGEMRYRRQNMDREVAQVLKNIAGKEGKVSAAQRFSMEAIAQVQFYTVDIAVWTAAYNRALKAEPGDTDKAVKYADRVVRLSQSAGGLKDLAAIQRHKGIVKGLTMFYSFFSALYAVLRGTGVEFSENVRNKPIAATTRAATRLFVLLALQSVATGLVRGELPEMEPENEDEKNMLQYIVKESVATALGTIPVVRDVAAGWASGYGYNGGAGTIAFEAVSKSLKGMEKIINEMGEEETVAKEADYEALARKYAPFVLLGGALTGLPAVQINRTLDGLGAYYDDADDWNWTDLVRGYDAKRAARRE